MQMLNMERTESLGTAAIEVWGHSTPFGVLIGNFYFFSGETPAHLYNYLKIGFHVCFCWHTGVPYIAWALILYQICYWQIPLFPYCGFFLSFNFRLRFYFCCWYPSVHRGLFWCLKWSVFFVVLVVFFNCLLTKPN